MKAQLLTGLVAVATAGSALVFGSPAHALNLKNDSPDFYDYIVDTYIQDERDAIEDAANHQLTTVKATGDKVDIFFVDTQPALALFADRLLYSINGQTSAAFDGRRVDDGAKQVEDGEGFSVATQKDDIFDFSIWTKGWWDDAGNDGVILGSDASANIDGKQHIVAYSEKIDGEDWLFLGFEDIPDLTQDMAAIRAGVDTPDWDYNDAFLAVRGLAFDQPDDPMDVPEPATVFGLLAVIGLGASLRRR